MKYDARRQLRIHSVNQIKSELVNLTLIVISFGAIPTLWSSLIRIPSIGFQPVMALHILMAALVLVAAFFRHRIGLAQRSGIIIVVMFLVGIGGLINFGLSSNGIIYLLSSTLFATIYFNVRVGIVVLSISIISIVAVALMINAEVMHFKVDFNIYNDLFSTWLTFIFSLFFLGIIILFSLGRFYQYFDEMVENLEEQVEMSTQESKRANAAKSQFMANMSHEIRTPMNGVLGMLRLLTNTELNEAQRHKANLAQSSAESLLALINDILDFSKIEAGKMEIEWVDFNPRRLFGEIAESSALSIQSRGIELLLDLCDVPYSLVKGDPGKLRQVLNNLVSNAVKFTRNGEIAIRAKIEEIGEEQLELSCEVSDTGIGIPADKLLSLFEAFTQVDASTTRLYGGTGLGLSISKKLCQLLGGDIEVESVLDKGSCFRFSIMLKPSQNATVVDAGIDISHLNLLIVDDNRRNAELIARQLSLWGASTQVADSANEAIRLCQKSFETVDKRFDAIFVDAEMPDLDGMALVDLITAESPLNQLKIVMMTAFSQVNDGELFISRGISGYFPKPATTSDLQKACHCILGNEPIARNGKVLTEDSHRELFVHESAEQLDESKLAQLQRYMPHILVVEDNLVNQQVIAGLLQEFHCSVDIAENGQQAITMLKLGGVDKNYDLIFMDCQMPLMDGYEASRRIRDGEAGISNRSIIIIAMTANVLEGDEAECLEAGMNDYLSKPIDPVRLLDRLCLWLSQSTELDITHVENIVATKQVSTSQKTTDINNTNEKHGNNVGTTVWDQPAVFARLMHNHGLLTKMVKAFLNNVDSTLECLRENILEENWDKIDHYAHALKGSTANVGGVEMNRIATRIEAAARTQNKGVLTEDLNLLFSARDALVSQLESYLASR